ncbi:hypothetical protein ACFX2B_037162 [Malus domestica]
MFIWPLSLLVRDGFLETVKNHLVGPFGLPIALGIPWNGHVLLDEHIQIFAYELQAFVCDDGLRDAKSTNDVPLYETLYVCLSCGFHGLDFHPLSEVVNCHDHHASAPSSGWH